MANQNIPRLLVHGMFYPLGSKSSEKRDLDLFQAEPPVPDTAGVPWLNIHEPMSEGPAESYTASLHLSFLRCKMKILMG